MALSEQEKIMVRRMADLSNATDLEHMENVYGSDEYLEHLAATNPAIKMALAQGVQKGGLGTVIDDFRAHRAAATVTINTLRKVTKGDATLTDGSGNEVYLPNPFFGVLEYESDYTRVINKYLPQDGSVFYIGMAKTSDKQGLIFTFGDAATEGASTIVETLTITAKGTPYVNLLRAVGGSAFTIVKPKVRISDVAKVEQFEQEQKMFYGSMWGKTSDDYIVPNDYETDILSKDTIRILATTINVDPEHTYVPLIAAPVHVPVEGASPASIVGSKFGVGFTFPIQEFRKFNEWANKAHAKR